ncbi:MAG: HlyD family type I secretion periplasmic adaptor subunit, partial [Pseudomonadota bacterium]
KVTAYDYLLYGTLSGRVERVGASTVEGPDGTPVFKVIVAADRNYLGPDTAPLPVSAGMAAVVEIQTGRNTVLNYIAKPILRARSDAFRGG